MLGVVVSLCVADNVGLRLLPFPLVPALVSTPGPSDQGPAASHSLSHGRTTGARVAMLTAPQSRAEAERPSPHVAAYALKFYLAVPSIPCSHGWEPDPPSAENSASVSRPKGRAPPRLV